MDRRAVALWKRDYTGLAINRRAKRSMERRELTSAQQKDGQMIDLASILERKYEARLIELLEICLTC